MLAQHLCPLEGPPHREWLPWCQTLTSLALVALSACLCESDWLAWPGCLFLASWILLGGSAALLSGGACTRVFSLAQKDLLCCCEAYPDRSTPVPPWLEFVACMALMSA